MDGAGERGSTSAPAAPRPPAIARSESPTVRWPALGGEYATRLRALLHQLDETQWWPADTIVAMQLRQLGALLEHAFEQVPATRALLERAGWRRGRELDLDGWRTLPVLERAQLLARGPQLYARSVPPRFEPRGEISSSGSTGTPVTVRTTAIGGLLWDALTMRDHFWQRRDFSAKMGVIRLLATPGHQVEPGPRPDWGAPASTLYATGPSDLMELLTPIEAQARWLAQANPAQLLTYPTNALALAQHCLAAGIAVPALRELRTMSEAMPEGLRDAAERAWGARVTDIYSSRELGYLALQCPDHPHYHVMSESVFLEVLHDDGRPCGPGETGRVVVTPLHNFGSPLLRYAVGDVATVGAPCPCGRGLPVLTRILGRERNLQVMADGSRHWPAIPSLEMRAAAPLLQYQFVQRTRFDVELHYVAERALTDGEQSAVVAIVREFMGEALVVTLVPRDALARSASGKWEEFRCEVPPGG